MDVLNFAASVNLGSVNSTKNTVCCLRELLRQRWLRMTAISAYICLDEGLYEVSNAK